MQMSPLLFWTFWMSIPNSQWWSVKNPLWNSGLKCSLFLYYKLHTAPTVFCAGHGWYQGSSEMNARHPAKSNLVSS